MMFRGHRVLILLCFVVSPRLLPAQPGPSALQDLLRRTGAYVTEFHRQLAGIVAEERYVQDAVTPPRKPLVNAVAEHRELASDLVLVKPPGVRDWLQFRDVFAVDGRPVRDRADRLTKLFLQPASGHAQMTEILAESARYNVGTIQRNMNAPLFPLLFLEPDNQARFKFKRTSDRAPEAARADPAPRGVFRAGAEAWVIAYEEKERPTFVRTTTYRSLPARGRFWIEPDTGRVLMSELILKDRDVNAIIDVSYQSEPLLGFLVPIEMRERYEGRRDKSRIEGVATYGRFRQFQVSTTETFQFKR